MEHSEHFDCTPPNNNDQLLVSAEYEAGYRARLEGSEQYRTATPSWQSGWSDADHDLQAGVLRDLSDDVESADSRWSTFGSGWDARICELPFEEKSSSDWKRDWVLADIAVAMAGRRKRA